MGVKISNAFIQGRELYLDHRKPIEAVLTEQRKKGVSYKRISQAAQAAANIHKKHYKIHSYFEKLGAEARLRGHIQYPKSYSLRYTPETAPNQISNYRAKLKRLQNERIKG